MVDFSFWLYRYGSIFKTHILGCPCVMISSPEAAKFVLVTRAHLFKPTFPTSKERLLGKHAIFFHQGDYHTKLRKLVLRAVLPEAIKNKVPNIEAIAKDSLQSWEGRLINTFQEMKIVSSPSPWIPKFAIVKKKNRKKQGTLLFSTTSLNPRYMFLLCTVHVQCCPAFRIWKGWSSVQRGSEAVLLHSWERVQFNAH